MYYILLLCIAISFSTFSQTIVNGRLNVLGISEDILSVNLQLQTDSGIDDLGTATIILTFNSSNISFPAMPLQGVDYQFNNFTGDNYEDASISRPFINQIRLNIELNSNNNGAVVDANPSWTDFAIINFSILNPDGMAGLLWDTENVDWAIYDGNNSTLWQTGTFTDADNVPLPVELISFSAAISENNVKLQWQTATELNNHGFSIERKNISSSADNKNVWDSISFIEGHGNSNSQKQYTFIDKAPRAGKYIYRLKQIDNDGEFAYSDEVEVEISVNDYFLSQNYPNPFNPSTSIQYSLPEKSSVKITIFSLTGEVIENTGYITKDPGSYDYKWSAANYSSGVYFFNIEASSLDDKRNFSSTKKMILTK